MIQKTIIVRCALAGLHGWSTCNIEAVSFLRNSHRHMFHFEAHIPVIDSDRELEFFMVQAALIEIIKDLYPKAHDIPLINFGNRSCEMIGEDICIKLAETYKLSNVSCSVFEDNENGAMVVWSAA